MSAIVGTAKKKKYWREKIERKINEPFDDNCQDCKSMGGILSDKCRKICTKKGLIDFIMAKNRLVDVVSNLM
jgi:hypothetical protein